MKKKTKKKMKKNKKMKEVKQEVKKDVKVEVKQEVKQGVKEETTESINPASTKTTTRGATASKSKALARADQSRVQGNKKQTTPKSNVVADAVKPPDTVHADKSEVEDGMADTAKVEDEAKVESVMSGFFFLTSSLG